jgi:hypothetical protein
MRNSRRTFASRLVVSVLLFLFVMFAVATAYTASPAARKLALTFLRVR